MPQGYEAIVKAYRRDYADDVRDYQEWFGDPSLNLAAAIERAAKSLWRSPVSGRLVMFSHQCRQGKERMAAAAEALAPAEPMIAAARTFADVRDIVAQFIGDRDGIGELTIYDVAHRIGSYLGLSPDEVYLHGGTREGAKALGLSGRRRTVALSELPLGLRSLSPAELEDVLCIYAEDLRRLGMGLPISESSTRTKCTNARGRRC